MKFLRFIIVTTLFFAVWSDHTASANEPIRHTQLKVSTDLPIAKHFGQNGKINAISDGQRNGPGGFATQRQSGIITIEFDKSYDLRGFKLWPHSNPHANRINAFRLKFYDKTGKPISTSQQLNGTRRSPNNREFDTFGFPVAKNTKRVDILIDSVFEMAFPGFGISEVEFVGTSTRIEPVNRPPIAADDRIILKQDETKHLNPLGNDSDPDRHRIKVRNYSRSIPSALSVKISAPKFSLNLGEGGLSGGLKSPGLDITAKGAPGTYEFNYHIIDELGATNQAKIIVTIEEPDNRVPQPKPDTISIPTVNGRYTHTFSPLVNDSDPDGDMLTIARVATTAGLRVKVDATRTRLTIDASGAARTQTFQYVVKDEKGAEASETVTINLIGPANRPPIARPDNYIMQSCETRFFNVLENDEDVDGRALTITKLSAVSMRIRARITSDKKRVEVTSTGQVGNSNFQYEISDGRGGTAKALVSISVPNRNTPPVARDDKQQLSTLMTFEFDPSNNDTDENGDPLTIESVSNVNPNLIIDKLSNGKIRIRTSLRTGVFPFTYTVSDGKGGRSSARVFIDVRKIDKPPVNRDPVARDDFYKIRAGKSALLPILDNDTDPDNDPLIIASLTPRNAPFNAGFASPETARVAVPKGTKAGQYKIEYIVTDNNGGKDGGIFIIEVPVNRPPVVQAEDVSIVLGDEMTLELIKNDTDPDGDPLYINRVFDISDGINVKILDPKKTSVLITTIHNPLTKSFRYEVSDGNGGLAIGKVSIALTRAVNTSVKKSEIPVLPMIIAVLGLVCAGLILAKRLSQGQRPGRGKQPRSKNTNSGIINPPIVVPGYTDPTLSGVPPHKKSDSDGRNWWIAPGMPPRRPSRPKPKRPPQSGVIFPGSAMLLVGPAQTLAPLGQAVPAGLQNLTGQFAVLKPAFKSTGRIGFAQEGKPTNDDVSLGTGFLISDTHVMTNQHVYEFYKQYLEGPDCGGIEFIAEHERDASDFVAFNGEPPLLVEGLDIAIFTLAKSVTDRKPINRVAIPTEDLDSRDICVIHYPCPFETDETILSVVEDDPIFAVKRISQGRIFRHTTDTDMPYGVDVMVNDRINQKGQLRAVCHNASTLGGSSGAPVLDLKTGELLGVHFAGHLTFNDAEAANLAMAIELVAGNNVGTEK